jgi:hypothetical protein
MARISQLGKLLVDWYNVSVDLSNPAVFALCKDVMFEDLRGLYQAYKWGELGGGTGTTNHASLQNLGYAYSGHSGFSPDGHTHAGYAPSDQGVTGGNSHDHNGGDGAQINHTTLSNAGSNTHATIDTHISATTTAHGGVLPSTSFSGVNKITVSITQPTNPTTGDLWVDLN